MYQLLQTQNVDITELIKLMMTTVSLRNNLVETRISFKCRYIACAGILPKLYFNFIINSKIRFFLNKIYSY